MKYEKQKGFKLVVQRAKERKSKRKKHNIYLNIFIRAPDKALR